MLTFIGPLHVCYISPASLAGVKVNETLRQVDGVGSLPFLQTAPEIDWLSLAKKPLTVTVRNACGYQDVLNDVEILLEIPRAMQPQAERMQLRNCG